MLEDGTDDLNDSLIKIETLKSDNEDLMKEVTFLKDMVSVKKKEIIDIKTEFLKLRQENCKLFEQVSHLKEVISKKQSMNIASDYGDAENNDETESFSKQTIAPKNYHMKYLKRIESPGFSSLKSQFSSSLVDARISKRITRSSSGCVSRTKDNEDTPLSRIATKSIKRARSGNVSISKRSIITSDVTDRNSRKSKRRNSFGGKSIAPLLKTPVYKPSLSLPLPISFGSEQNNIVPNPFYSSIAGSVSPSCSEARQDESHHKIKFTIVTEEKNMAGNPIPDLECAMRPRVMVKQVKRSYCKRMGLDRSNIILRLVSNDVSNNSLLNDETNIQVCEGRIIEAVTREDEVEMKILVEVEMEPIESLNKETSSTAEKVEETVNEENVIK